MPQADRRRTLATVVDRSEALSRQPEQLLSVGLTQLAGELAGLAVIEAVLVAITAAVVEADTLALGLVKVPENLVVGTGSRLNRQQARLYLAGVAGAAAVRLGLEVVGVSIAARVGELVAHARGGVEVPALEFEVALAGEFGGIADGLGDEGLGVVGVA